MLKIIGSVFGEVLKDYLFNPIGNNVYIHLDDNRRIELSFHNTHSADSYDSIKLVLVPKENGQLHCQIVKFSDIFECMQDLTHPNKIGKHIWYNDKKYSWYGKPTKEDIEIMQDTLLGYIDTWI